MIGHAKRQEKEKLSIAIDQLLNEMLTYGPDSPEYPELLERLEKINNIRRSRNFTKGVSPDTMALVAGNLIGILIIVGYEQKHVMVSTAQKLLLKAH